MKIAITGGFGFIGTNFVKYWLKQYRDSEVLIIDSETYAADPDGVLSFIGAEGFSSRVHFERIDIRDQLLVARVLQKHRPQAMFHFAAESHVCRSIAGPKDFVTTNIIGTWNLLEEWRHLYGATKDSRPFIHVSTDEVFGQLELYDDPFTEESPLRPRSPYAASKASSDLLALSYFETYGLQVRVTNCSNNFGPHQHHEKLIPATFNRLLSGRPARLYGNGQQRRDWLFVEDHCRALDTVMRRGENGLRYCIGGGVELSNMDLVKSVHDAMVEVGLDIKPFHVEHDPNARPTDDFRYAIDSSFVEALGWKPSSYDDFEENLKRTVRWYAEKQGFDLDEPVFETMRLEAN